MTSPSTSAFAGFRFPREVIALAVRWYLRYGLSYRDVEELLTERGITVDHVTIYRRVQRFTPEFVEAARTCRHVPGDRWFVDETHVKVNGRWTYLYIAVDQHGQVIDVWLSTKRDLTAALHTTEQYANNRVEADHGAQSQALPDERQCPAEWWGLRVDLRCLRAAVDSGGGVSIAGRVELGHGALGAVAELEPLIGIV